MNKWHLWTSFGHMPPGGMSSWHRLINTHNEQWWQWSLSIHSPTREPRLRRQGLTTVSWTCSSQWYCLSLSGAESSLSGGDFETQGELQGHIINLLLGRLFLKNVCVAILIRWKKEATFFVILCFIISRKVKMQLKHTKKEWEEVGAVYGEGAVTESMLQSRKFLKFHLENSHWAMLHGWVGQLKLLEIKSRV